MVLLRLALALAVCVVASPALAQPEGPVVGSEQAVSEQARTLFQQGLGFADRGDWERAVERFRHALELRDTPNVRYNLAQSLAQGGRLVEALEELERVLAFSSAADDVLEAATSLKAELQPRLGHLLIRVNQELDGAQVTIDGRPIGSPRPPGNVATDPGVRVVRLLREAEELDVEEVHVPEGGEASVVLEVPPALRAVRLATGADRPDPVPRSGSGANLGPWWAWALIGLAVVAGAVVVGIVLSQGNSMDEPGGSTMSLAARPSGLRSPFVLQF